MKYIRMLILVCLALPLLPAAIKGQADDRITLEAGVYDGEGNPVAGAMVFADDGRSLEHTDPQGRFSITVPSGSMLHISAEGFMTQGIKAEPGVQRIILGRDPYGPWVNVAFRRVERQDLLGSIGVINPDEFINQDYNSWVAEGMAGRASGLLWANNIWGMENALILIDGVPRRFDDIRLDEVEQITVLKGVNAVALYGSHAARGVVLITTKRGEAYTRRVNIRANSGIAMPKMLPRYLGSVDYMTLHNEARANDGLPAMYDPQTIAAFATGDPYRFPDIDYFSSDYLNRFAQNSDVSAQFSGGVSGARFYSNIGWERNTSLLRVGEGANEVNNRFNVRGNVDLRLNDIISSSIDVSARVGANRQAVGNFWWNASRLRPNRYSPLLPIGMIHPDSTALRLLAEDSRNIIDGRYVLGGTVEHMTNPIADLYAGGFNQQIGRVLQLTNRIDLDLDGLLQGLSSHTQLHADYFTTYDQSVNNTYSVFVPTWDASYDSIIGLQRLGVDARPGIQNINNTAQVRRMGFSTQLNYARTLQELHHVSAILLASGTSATTSGVIQPNANANLGLHLGYNYNRRYWVDFSGSAVSSTRLPEGNRVGFSPTLALGWLLSAEEFLANSTMVDHLKLTASGGMLSTDLPINGHFLYQNVYSLQGWFAWNDDRSTNQAWTSVQGANPDLTFAQRQEVNLGVEGAFFNRQLWLEATLFLTQMDNIPTQRFSQYPNYFSSLVPFTNFSANQYTGFDILMNVNRRVGEVELSLGLNATYVSSEVIRTDELFADQYQNRTGKPMDAIFGLVSDGFFADQTDINNHAVQAFGEVRPGDIRYVDQNGDEVINERDEVMIGRWIAPFSYAMNIQLSFRNFTLYALGTGSVGGNGMRQDDYYWVDGDLKYSEQVLNRWTPATQHTATYPRLTSLRSTNNHRVSDFWMFNSNRFDLRKVQITYTLPERILRNTFIRELGIYAMGSHLFTFSRNRDILDLNVGSAPQFRYFSLGVRSHF